MGWVIERVTPAADGANTVFAISTAPVAGSLLMFFPATPWEKVGATPSGMQYSLSGTTVTFGIAPANGRTPWCRYYVDV